MGASDGYILGRSKIVDHGPDSQRFVVVILGDGYTAAQIEQYKTDVDALVNRVRTTAPFDSLWCGINVYRIDVVSTESGADDPLTCADLTTGSGAAPRTFFDATFCGNGVRRGLTVDSGRAFAASQAQAPYLPGKGATLCIVNSPIYGGTGGSVGTTSLHPNAPEIFIHEMGHTVFGLADEYDCLTCLAGETGHDNYTFGEPGAPNVTANTNPATIKWNALLTNPADPLPTTVNANCAMRDPQSNPRPAAYVGAYAGATTYHCGAFRPQFNCKMRALGAPFCAVCDQVIRTVMAPFLPAESLVLRTPSIAFTNIPEGGVTTYRAIVFEIVSCARRTFRIVDGPTGGFGTPLGTSVSVTEADADPVAEARLWISFVSSTVGVSAPGTVKVRCDETGQEWIINIVANTVPRPKTAVVMVLDHSGSMAEDAGIGVTKVAKLREAANVFIGAMLDGDAIGVVRFDDTAEIVGAVTVAGPPLIGAGRVAAAGIVNGPQLDPDGGTSIGAGVQRGRDALLAAQASASPPYDVTAMVVLTDGVENVPPMLAAVSGSITSNTFAVGLGLADNISVAALDTLTQGHHGYLLVTGALTPDQSARLTKYFLQILAGITSANVILDPPGYVVPGVVHRIPFQVSEADISLDVFLLSEAPEWIEFALETPDGQVITRTSALANVEFVPGPGAHYYRLSLPAIPEAAHGSHGGEWNVLLTMGRSRLTSGFDLATTGQEADERRGLAYEVVVHCHSNLTLNAYVQQGGYVPGSTVRLLADLREYDVPVEGRARVSAEITDPKGARTFVALAEEEPGRFGASFATSLAGIYVVRFRATGSTFAAQPFQREQTLTVTAFRQTDHPVGTGEARGLCGFLQRIARWFCPPHCPPERR